MSFKKICFIIGAAAAAGAVVTGYMIKRASDKRRQSIKEELDDTARSTSDDVTKNTLEHIENLLHQKFGKKAREEESEDAGVLDKDVTEVTENETEDLVETGDE